MKLNSVNTLPVYKVNSVQTELVTELNVHCFS